METIADLLAERARGQSSAVALVDDASSEAIHYLALAERVGRRAAALGAAGVRAGDRVAILLPNSLDAAETLLAAAAAGAIAVPVNLRWTAAEVDFLLGDAEPRVLVSTRERLDALGLLRHRPPLVEPAALHAPTCTPSRAAPDDVALILYTSGTTGRPKGAMLTHRNLLSNARAIARWLALGPADRMLTVMPLFHANAIVIGLVTPLVAGGSAVIAERFRPTTYWASVERHRPTTGGTVPTMLALLLGQAEAPPPAARASLRFLLTGSAPVPPDVLLGFEERFGVPVLEGYGLTECTCRATFNPIDGRRRPGSCGLPLEALEIIDGDGQAVAAEGVGEIVLRGPHVMAGYFRQPEATERALRGGWLHTGDLARRDADGFVHIVGRATELIIRGGENVYPREIEDVLYAHPAVAEAAVLGTPDPIYGEVVAAFVAPRPGATLDPDAMRRWCAARLADYKCPVRVTVLPELPKGPTGKILKAPLRSVHP